MSSTRRAKQLAGMSIPAEALADFPVILDALAALATAEEAFRAAEDELSDLDMLPVEHKAEVRAAIRAGETAPTFDTIAHEVHMEDAQAAVNAAARAVRSARVAYGQALDAHAAEIAAVVAHFVEDARTELVTLVDGLRPAFDAFAALHNLAEVLDGDAYSNGISREAVLYNGPVRVGRFVDALDILDRAAQAATVREGRTRIQITGGGRGAFGSRGNEVVGHSRNAQGGVHNIGPNGLA